MQVNLIYYLLKSEILPSQLLKSLGLMHFLLMVKLFVAMGKNMPVGILSLYDF